MPRSQQSGKPPDRPRGSWGPLATAEPGPLFLSLHAGLSSRDKEMLAPWHTVIVQYNRMPSHGRPAGLSVNCSISLGNGGFGHDMDLAGLRSICSTAADDGGFEAGLGMRRVPLTHPWMSWGGGGSRREKRSVSRAVCWCLAGNPLFLRSNRWFVTRLGRIDFRGY